MPGTRTAPTVGISPTAIQISIKYIDYQGKTYSDSLTVPITVTNAEIEALVAEIQPISNASIYAVEVTQQFNSVGDSSNAVEEVWNSGADLIRTTMKNAVPQSATQAGIIRAPIDDLFIENTQELDPTNVDFADYLTDLLAVVNGGAGGSGTYEVVWARFAQHQQKNAKVPI